MSANDTAVRQRILTLLQNFLMRRGINADPARITDLSLLGIDSLAITELVFEIAEEFHIDDRTISDDTLRRLTTVDSLVDAVSAAYIASQNAK